MSSEGDIMLEAYLKIYKLYSDLDIKTYLGVILKPYFNDVEVIVDTNDNVTIRIDIDKTSKSRIETKLMIDVILRNCKFIDIEDIQYN